MSQLLEWVANWMQGVVLALGYPGLALVMFLESVFPPIPSEVVLPFAGFLVSRGELNLVGVVLATTTGAVSAAVVLYYIGRWAEDHVLLDFVRKYGKWFTISEADWLNALHIFDTRGEIIIFVGRLMPIVRSIISLPAGMNHMPLSRFLLFTTLGTALWNTVLAGLGMVLGENWETILTWTKQYENVMLVVLGVGAAGFVGYHLYQWWNKRRINP